MKRPTGFTPPPSQPDRARRGSAARDAAPKQPAPEPAAEPAPPAPLDLKSRLAAASTGGAQTGRGAGEASGGASAASPGKAGAAKTAAGRSAVPRRGAKVATASPASEVPSRLASWRSTRKAVQERRKVERGEVRRFTRRQRIRRRAWLIGSGVVVAVLLSAVVLAFSPFMSLKHIQVEGASRIKAAQVQQALSGQLGRPLPLVNLADVRHDLDDFRLIRSYSTELHPPSTLVVRIDERVPLGVVKLGGAFELVDQAGVVISSTTSAPKGFPMIALAAGETDPQKSPSFAAAAAVLAALPQSVLGQVADVTAISANSVSFTLDSGKSVVWGDTSQPALKQADLSALLVGAPGAAVYDVSSPESPVTR